MTDLRLAIVAPTGLGLLLVACSTLSPGAASPSPRGGASPSPVASATAIPTSVAPSRSPTAIPGTPLPVTSVTSAAQAAAVVFASNPLFKHIEPLRPRAVGQATWYEAQQTLDGFSVSVSIGSGDCPSGCINKHTWIYSVGRDGQVSLTADEGPEVEAPGIHATTEPATVNITLVAGPVCPVERDPPDPSCAPRPVKDGVVVLREPSGTEVARATADADGKLAFSVPGGAYYAEPQAVDGLMGVAAPVAFAVVGGDTMACYMEYDTGIR